MVCELYLNLKQKHLTILVLVYSWTLFYSIDLWVYLSASITLS